MREVVLEGTTNGSGALTAYSDQIITGSVIKCVYAHTDAPGTGIWQLQVDDQQDTFIIVGSFVGHPSADTTIYPKQAGVDTSNSALTAATLNSISSRRFVFSINSGGANKTYKWIIYVADETKKGLKEEKE